MVAEVQVLPVAAVSSAGAGAEVGLEVHTAAVVSVKAHEALTSAAHAGNTFKTVSCLTHSLS